MEDRLERAATPICGVWQDTACTLVRPRLAAGMLRPRRRMAMAVRALGEGTAAGGTGTEGMARRGMARRPLRRMAVERLRHRLVVDMADMGLRAVSALRWIRGRS